MKTKNACAGLKLQEKPNHQLLGASLKSPDRVTFLGNSDRGLLHAGVNRTGCRPAPLPGLVPQHGGLELVLVNAIGLR